MVSFVGDGSVIWDSVFLGLVGVTNAHSAGKPLVGRLIEEGDAGTEGDERMLAG